MRAGTTTGLPLGFIRDLKAYRQGRGEAPGRLYAVGAADMLPMMKEAAPVLGRLAVEQGLTPELLFVDVRRERRDFNRRLCGDEVLASRTGWLVWGSLGEYTAWLDSRGDGPGANDIAAGLAITDAGELREFAVAPYPSQPTEVVSSCRGLPTGDDWPIGTAIDLRAVPVDDLTLYHYLVRFADGVVQRV